MANNDEPRIQLGKYENGVLEIREGFKKLDDESMEGYEHVRKVIFPASLEELDEDVFSETKELEELDFSRVTKLKEIPGDLVSCKTKITQFVIPQGVKEVGDGFLSEAKKGTKIFVPASVKQMGYINGNDDNDLEVYLFASGIDVDDFETDVNTLYVLPQDYADYAEKLKDRESEAKLREIPDDLVNFYSNIVVTAAPAAAKPTVPPASPVMSQEAPVAPAMPVNSPVSNNKPAAKQLIPAELDSLIKQYLTDGVLTDKERQVILRKAEKLGLDRDEIDLYLDAEVQKIDQETDAAARRQKGKTCPYCGGSIPQLTDKCPHCGENITPDASKELQEIFDNLEDALVNLKSGKDIHASKATVERYVRKAKMYYGSNPKVQKLLEEVEIETINAEKNAKSLARKNTMVNLITANWKVTAVIAIALIAAIIWGFNAIGSAIKGPDVTDSPQAVMEAVNQALSSGDIAQAESYCAAFMQKNDDYDDLRTIMGAYDAIIKYQASEVTNYIKAGDLDSADEYLSNISIMSGISKFGTSMIVDKYDSMFFNVINAHIKNGDLDSAESLALVWKSKIGNDLSWKDSSCYKTLKAKFKSSGRDFSALKSDYDY